MARASLFWAATHPCYDLWTSKYICECGYISNGVAEHNKHMLECHMNNIPLIYKSVSWKVWDKWKEKYGWNNPNQEEIHDKETNREEI